MNFPTPFECEWFCVERIKKMTLQREMVNPEE